MTFLGADHDEAAAIAELRGSATVAPTSDRSAAIIAGSLLETTLTRVLISHLHEHKKLTTDLFNVTGAFGYFGTKISLGFLIGLYSDGFRKELEIVKEVRNGFAHRLAMRDFTTPRMHDLSMNLKILEEYVHGPTVSMTGSENWIGTAFSIAGHGKPISIHVQSPAKSLANARERFLIGAAVLTRLLSSIIESNPIVRRIPSI